MAYKIRPGIVHVRICDADLLIATRPVWESCPRIRRIPRLWAACWAVMEQDALKKTDEDVIQAFAGLLKKSNKDIRIRFDKMFRTLFEEGYLVESQEDS